MLNAPKGPVYHCRTKKEGHGYKQECLNPNFLIYLDGRIVCSLCGTVYSNLDELKLSSKKICGDCLDFDGCGPHVDYNQDACDDFVKGGKSDAQ